jgi:hypothetical protein
VEDFVMVQRTFIGAWLALSAASAQATAYDCEGDGRRGRYEVELETFDVRMLKVTLNGIDIIDVRGRDVWPYSESDAPGRPIDRYKGGDTRSYFASIGSHRFGSVGPFDASLRVYAYSDNDNDFVGVTCVER